MSVYRNRKAMYGFILSAALAAAQPLPAFAEEPHRFEIATTTDAARTIHEFGAQSGTQIFAAARDLTGKKLNGVTGTLSTDAGLRMLLAGTGLAPRYIGDRTVALVRDERAADSPRSAVEEERSGDSTLSLEEVVVTAQKRLERLQDVPMSITAIGGEEIEQKKLVGMQDYLTFVPGVTMVDWGVGAPRIVMRGLGVSTDSEQATVATYIGEVPLNNPLGTFSTDIKLVDIQRVEILRGPQGTLYGGGALGGAIRNIPVAPDLSGFGGRVDIGYSHTAHSDGDNGSLTGVLNVPLIRDQLALRVAAYRFENAGYVDLVSEPAIEARSLALGVPVQVNDDVGNQTYEGVRATLLWQPNERLDATLMLGTQQLQEFGRNDIQLALGGYRATALRTGEEFKSDDFDMANLVVNYDLGWARLTSSTTSYQGDTPSVLDQSRLVAWGSNLHETADRDAFVQELRLKSQWAGPLQTLAGLYYEDFDSHRDQVVTWTGSAASLLATHGITDRNGLLNSFVTDTAKQKALFGEASYQLAERIKLTAGGRWFDYDRHTVTMNSGRLLAASSNLGAAEDGAIYKGGVDFTPHENALLYAQWSQGFRLGRGAPPGNTGLCDANSDGREDSSGLAFGDGMQASDRTENFELGGKLTLLGGRLQLNSAIYRIDWTDLPITVVPPAGGICSIFANGGGAQSKGAEMEIGFRLLQALQINLSASHTDAKFTTNQLGVKGQRLPMSARVNGSLGLQYDFDLSGRDGYVRSDLSYIGDYSTGLGRPPSGDYYRFDLSAGVNLGLVDVELYGRNLNGADNVTTYFFGARGWRVVPTTLGANLRYRF